MEFSENYKKILLIILLIFGSSKLLQYLFMDTDPTPSPMSLYLNQNYTKIGSIVIIFIIFIGIFKFIGWDFNTDENSTLESKYVVEGYNSMDKNNSNLSPESFWRVKGKGFCEAISTDVKKHKAACKQLSFSNCSQFVNCCAAVNGFDEKDFNCVPTTSTGSPLFTEDNMGQNIDLYWYKGKCNGKGCDLNKKQREEWIKKRSEFVENNMKDAEIINEAIKEANAKEKKKAGSCKQKNNSCYLWGVPDAEISPFE